MHAVYFYINETSFFFLAEERFPPLNVAGTVTFLEEYCRYYLIQRFFSF